MLGMNLRKVALGAMDAPLGLRVVQKRAFAFPRKLETPSQRGFTPLMMRNGTERRFLKTSATKKHASDPQGFAGFWKRFTGPKVMPERWTAEWYREVTLICTVFAITGSSTMILVRPAVSKGLGLHGSMKEGPWSYRICSLVIMTPIYATLLVMVGTVFGRHHYFRHFSVKMWSRFGIPPEMLDASFHETKKHFRKW